MPHAHGLPQGGGIGRRYGCLSEMGVQRFPLEFFKEDRAGNVGEFAPEAGDELPHERFESAVSEHAMEHVEQGVVRRQNRNR